MPDAARQLKPFTVYQIDARVLDTKNLPKSKRKFNYKNENCWTWSIHLSLESRNSWEILINQVKLGHRLWGLTYFPSLNYRGDTYIGSPGSLIYIHPSIIA